MALGNGQQAIQDTAIGRTKWSEEKKLVMIEDIQYFDAECVNPPPSVKTEDWLKSGFAGAKCK
jgi:branched-chain amino acid transport system substrate-binding protein